jgi:phenylalanyl-tRNA synthetase alpha chain
MANVKTNAKLDSLKDAALAAFKAAPSSKDLYDLKVQYLGKSGSLTEVMKEMATLPKEEKPLFGKWVNEVKQVLDK